MTIQWNRKDKVGGDGYLRGTCLTSDTKPTVSGPAILIDETGAEFKWTGTQWIQTASGGAASVEPTQLANERNPGTANQYGVSVDESNGSVVDVSTNSTDVSSSTPALLFGVYVNTAIATEAVGLHDGTGGTEIITLPTGLAAGTFIKFPGIKFNTALFVESTSATGSITVCWRPQ